MRADKKVGLQDLSSCHRLDTPSHYCDNPVESNSPNHPSTGLRRTMGSLSMRALTLRPAVRFAGLLAILTGFVVVPVGAQIGTDLCACSPAVYTFELIFDATCDETNVDGLGIENSDCFVSAAGIDPDITDFRPVAVSSIDILELDQTLVPFVFRPYRGSFRNGDTFTYTSVVGTDPNLPPGRIPGGFQMNILGVNAIDQDIQNVWIITFTNECGVFPIFSAGEQIGWTKLIDISLPEEIYCPREYAMLACILIPL